MNSTFHQTLSINTFDTEVIPFTSELYLEGMIMQNASLIAFDFGSEPDILASQLVYNNGKNKKLDLVIKIDENIGIVELKRGLIDRNAYEQIRNYILASATINQKIIDNDLIDNNPFDQNKYFGLLVGSGIEEDVLRTILNENEKIDSIKIYVIILQQHKTSNDQLFLTSNILIKPKNRAQNARFDFTKYRFKDKEYGKGRLVLAVIEDYIKKNDIDTIGQLNQEFPNTLQGTYDMVKNSEELEISENLRKRYFVNNPIQLSNKEEIVVSNQWGIGNIQNFIQKASELGYEIQIPAN